MQLVIGRIEGVHGVRGEVAVDVRTDDPDARFVVDTRLHTEPASAGPLTLRAARWHRGRLLLRFDEVPGRDAAERLRGTLLVVDSADVPPSAESDEFHDHELVGLAVVDLSADPLGSVTDVLHLPGQDVLVVRPQPRRGDNGAGEGAGEVFVPFVAAIVTEVDPGGARLVIDPPPGLIDVPGDT